MNLCLVKTKYYDTQGQKPTKLFKVNRGVVYETIENKKFCYYYVSTVYKNTSKCFDEQHVWSGLDDASTAGGKILFEEMNATEMKQRLHFSYFPPNGDMNNMITFKIEYIDFQEKGEDGSEIKFSNIARQLDLIITDKFKLVVLLGMTVDYGKGLTGAVCILYVIDETKTAYLTFDTKYFDFLTTISVDNFKNVAISGNDILVGFPKSRDDPKADISQNVFLMSVVDLPSKPEFPVTLPPPIIIPPQKRNLFQLGGGVGHSNKYAFIADPFLDRGVAYVVRKVDGTTIDLRATLIPFPRWGSYQNFALFMAAFDNADDTTDLFVAAPTAWIHDNVRKVQKEGRKTSEYIGVIYHFVIVDDETCEAKGYYVVQNDEKSGIMNSTISGMVNGTIWSL
ncbi:hypothetical protein EIN_486030 [Entamoeba invadens IP1]|uniref:Uncharacterized protein n=1 Tax=Entamoeba invadens IP1 TaxID=370355 RepID=A0A0A1U4M2_ENTIV|nr:hypothetical protein EIN_486030 [Entamoeba invadens IP1]ELP89201.1 hypothetical protein EIN_486030 [Entamoeba invadens IP1]|eukprot:XP_004255972.1 hypothetical protein EIN_486030 [Entamoeba invadens IP1]